MSSHREGAASGSTGSAAPSEGQGALAGLRVLDLSRVLAGPLCTMLLGDMGADIVKVEQPGTGDDTRAWGPPFAGTESAYFLGVNRNKRSMTLDLKSPRGQDILRQLIPRMDVMVDNFKPGTLPRWGLDDGWFADRAPALVRCSITGYGSSGPQAGRPGYDFILQAETGLMSITGEPDGEPMKLGVAIVDICAGLVAAIALLAALQARSRTGKGQRVDVSLHDTGLVMLANVASNYLISGERPARFGNAHPNIVPYRTYPADDGDLAVAVGNDQQFRRFAAILGHPEWADDPRFARNQDRVANRAAIDALVGEVIRGRRRSAWIQELEAADVPCGPINSVAEALSSPQVLAREMVVSLAHRAAGPIKVLGPPFGFSKTPPSVRRPPPMLGEHTEEILEAELGLARPEIQRLRSEGVV